MQDSEEQYCHIEPYYPPALFLNIIFMSSNRSKYTDPWPLANVFETPQEVSDYTKIVTSQAVKNSNFFIPETSMLVPLTLNEKIPLKKEYWQKPVFHLDEWVRTDSIMKSLEMPEFYKMLITPSNYVNGKFELVAGIVFLLKESAGLIDKFMLTSDWPVNPKAKTCASYFISYPLRFNWIQGKIEGKMEKTVIRKSWIN